MEARVVTCLNSITFRQGPIADVIEIFNLRWEPRHLWCSYYCYLVWYVFHLFECFIYIRVVQMAVKVCIDFNQFFIVEVDQFCRPWLDPSEINFIACEYIESLLKDARLIFKREWNWCSIFNLPICFLVIEWLSTPHHARGKVLFLALYNLLGVETHHKMSWLNKVSREEIHLFWEHFFIS